MKRSSLTAEAVVSGQLIVIGVRRLALPEAIRSQVEERLLAWERFRVNEDLYTREQAAHSLAMFLRSMARSTPSEGFDAAGLLVAAERFDRLGYCLGKIQRNSRNDVDQTLIEAAFEPLVAQGKNSRGVPVYTGVSMTPDAEQCRQRVSKGVALLVGGISFAFLGFLSSRADAGVGSFLLKLLGAVVIIAGIVHAHSGFTGHSKRRLLSNLIPIEEASAQLNVPQLSLLLSVRQSGREPKCIVEGREFFRPEDLGEAMTLLRPAESSSGDRDCLLRVAGPSETADKNLLRPVADESRS